MSVTARLSLATAAVLALTLLATVVAPQPAEAQTTGEAVVAEAQNYLGVPFVYGGASAYGLDCSGLVSVVYSAFGIYLPHSSYSQMAYGTPVSYPSAGDLVFSDYGYGYASHVGIATGDGYMINAPYPGTVVRYDPIIPSYVNGYTSIV